MNTLLMSVSLIYGAFATAPAATNSLTSAQPHIINLSCMEALVATDRADLAGVFAFVADKDSSAAFGDMLIRSPKSLQKFVEKVQRDKKDVGGISKWDKEVLSFMLAVYASPLAQTLEMPSSGTLEKVAKLSQEKAMTLGEMSAKRKK